MGRILTYHVTRGPLIQSQGPAERAPAKPWVIILQGSRVSSSPKGGFKNQGEIRVLEEEAYSEKQGPCVYELQLRVKHGFLGSVLSSISSVPFRFPLNFFATFSLSFLHSTCLATELD